jgi:hypothetical protein
MRLQRASLEADAKALIDGVVRSIKPALGEAIEASAPTDQYRAEGRFKVDARIARSIRLQSRNCSHQGDVCGFDSTSSKVLFRLTGCGSQPAGCELRFFHSLVPVDRATPEGVASPPKATGGVMSMSHKAYAFDWRGFELDLRPLLLDALVADKTGQLETFIGVQRHTVPATQQTGPARRLRDGERLQDLRRSLEVRPLSARVEETLRRADRAPEQCIGGPR